jgi:hypothetical protein
MSKPKNPTGVRFHQNGKVTNNEGVLLGHARMVTYEPTMWRYTGPDGEVIATRRIRADLIPFALDVASRLNQGA